MQRKFIFLTLLLLMISGIYLFRIPLLQSVAKALIKEDSLQKADALFVLSGGAYDRGNEAAKIFNSHYSEKVICTGGNPVVELKVFSIDTLESDMTLANLHRLYIPDACIAELRYGTSTLEESDTILNYCKQYGFKKIIILSSLLHTRRVNKVFRKKFEASGIQLLIHGAPSSRFDEMLWWYSEDGLIAVNNEWVKTIYYWWKY